MYEEKCLLYTRYTGYPSFEKSKWSGPIEGITILESISIADRTGMTALVSGAVRIVDKQGR